MEYGRLELLREKHPAWRLMRADHAPLIASFLHEAFIVPNLRVCPESELVTKLDDRLFHLRRTLGDECFPRQARAYLDDWAGDRSGWLRKSYVSGSDEPVYDLSAAAEQALGWLQSLGPRPFVGTESRLISIFELLRQLVEESETDPSLRISELEKRRAEIDAEIERINEGHLHVLEPAAVRDRFSEIVATADRLLSDFRLVEQNFRTLDRTVREKITTWDGQKGDLLEDIFGQRDAISDSDQGRSFAAFWDLLMSEDRQRELEQLLDQALELAPIKQLAPDLRIRRVHHAWIFAGEATQRTVAQLSGEFRRFLDDKVWLENKRIMEILRGIEQSALELREQPPMREEIMAIDGLAPAVALVMDLPLFAPPYKPQINDVVNLADDQNIPANALFDLVHLDKTRLKKQIWQQLQDKNKVTLQEIVEDMPIEQGLGELLAYMSLATDDDRALINDQLQQAIPWQDEKGNWRQATLPLVIFTREPTGLKLEESDHE